MYFRGIERFMSTVLPPDSIAMNSHTYNHIKNKNAEQIKLGFWAKIKRFIKRLFKKERPNVYGLYIYIEEELPDGEAVTFSSMNFGRVIYGKPFNLIDKLGY